MHKQVEIPRKTWFAQLCWCSGQGIGSILLLLMPWPLVLCQVISSYGIDCDKQVFGVHKKRFLAAFGITVFRNDIKWKTNWCFVKAIQFKRVINSLLPRCRHVATYIWVNIGSGNGLLPAGTKPLPLTNGYFSLVRFSSIHPRAISQLSAQANVLSITSLKIIIVKIIPTIARGQWVNNLRLCPVYDVLFSILKWWYQQISTCDCQMGYFS